MNHEEIFKHYLHDTCPCCGVNKNSEDYFGHTEAGGKVMACYFRCQNCFSEWIVGFKRNTMPIECSILIKGKYLNTWLNNKHPQ